MSAVLFRVDAGPVVGLGHLQRCLSLASALRREGIASVFLTNREPAARTRVSRFAFEAHALDTIPSWTPEDCEAAVALAKAVRSRAIVVDSDVEGPGYLHRLREAGFLVCAIEDLAPHPFPCQMVVNGDAHAQRLDYVSSTGDTQFLLGPSYAILREEFWQVPVRHTRSVPAQVLVTLGGDDPHRLMAPLLRRLDALPWAFRITAILGPFFSHAEEVRAAAAASAHPIRLLTAPSTVRDVMCDADLAISAAGQTLYELARVGCPTIAIRTAANQQGQLHALRDRGVVHAAGCVGAAGLLQAVEDGVRLLWDDAPRRHAMSASGARLLDGQGARRVALALARLAMPRHAERITVGAGERT